MTIEKDTTRISLLGKTILEKTAEALGKPEDSLPVVALAAATLMVMAQHHLTHRITPTNIPAEDEPFVEPSSDVLPDTGS